MCFVFSFVIQSKDKVALRNLSMVLRQLGMTQEEKNKYIEESVEKAKEAVSLDAKDGVSWCKSLSDYCHGLMDYIAP